MAFLEDLSHCVEQLALIRPILDPEHLHYVVVKLVYRQSRIKDIGRQNTGIQATQYPAKRGGLAGANFARQNDQPLCIFEPVIETRQNLVIARCKNDEPWVRR